MDLVQLNLPVIMSLISPWKQDVLTEKLEET